MVKLDEREKDMLKICVENHTDGFVFPFGPLCVLVAKLYEMLKELGLDLLA